MLQIKDVHKTYVTGDLTQTALDGVTFNLRDSEFVAVLGPSGSGKTTLLNVVGGLDRYDSGDLVINGVSTRKYSDRDWDSYRNHTIGFVFQSYNLIPHQSVLANVELALTISGVSRGERRERAQKALIEVGLGDQLHKKPNQMSGGQMQRVAIARALVNDPDILLADEPTGALDSETSLQVMELLKEVAKDRLVVLVTHNNELAQQYASRIITLCDGAITGDTDPFTPDDAGLAEPEHRNMGYASMSFATALRLSFNNLRTKLGRTLLTAFAGSIGIIGIALILSLSTGVNQYIDDIQLETMLSYPISIEAQTIDLSNMMELGMQTHNNEVDHDLDAAYSNSMGFEVASSFTTSITENNLTDFKNYLENPDSEINRYIGENGVIYSYDLSYGAYTYDPDGELVNTDGVEFDSSSNFISAMSAMPMSQAMGTSMRELMPGKDGAAISTAVTDNYELLSGSWPTEYNEVVLTIDANNEISLDKLYELGYLPSAEYKELVAALDTGDELDVDTYSFSYDELCGKSIYLIPACDFYTQGENGAWRYLGDGRDAVENLISDAIELKVTGVIRPTEDAGYTFYGTVGYLHTLTDYLIDYTDESAVVTAQRDDSSVNVLSGLSFSPASDEEKAADTKSYISALSVTEKAGMFTALMQSAGGGAMDMQTMLAQGENTLAYMFEGYIATADNETLTAIYDRYISPGTYQDNMEAFGVISRDAPSSVNIYADSFEAKDGISECIEEYNKTADTADQITYTDYVGLLMSSVTTIVNVISYVLIAFVAVSLVVSSIMIGIITYISVLERTKEIGILRAIGASKRNISQVFNAETFIIGLCSGLIGVGMTLLILIPGNAVIHALAGTADVSAALPAVSAVILVALSMALTLISGLIPAKKAANKDPVAALRTE